MCGSAGMERQSPLQYARPTPRQRGDLLLHCMADQTAWSSPFLMINVFVCLDGSHGHLLACKGVGQMGHPPVLPFDDVFLQTLDQGDAY